MCPSSSENVDSSSNDEGAKDEELPAFGFFPERKGDKITRSWFRTLFLGENRDNIQRLKCERTVHNVVSESPLIKFLMSALKSSGCEFDLHRHVSCEPCSKIVTGGYDCEMNQVVICQNTATSKNQVHSALAHEMIHMFDACRTNLDFSNIDHLTCTEIRAANLLHCSFLSSMVMGTSSLFRIKRQHQECVKRKAMASVMAVKNVTIEEAQASMDRVFTKCYNDLEPIGRRIRRNSKDIDKIYRDRFLYGYAS